MTGRRSMFLARCLGGCAWALFVCCVSVSSAQLELLQDPLKLKSGQATPKPEYAITLTPAEAKPGDEVTLTVDVKLPKGYYIYSTTGEFDGRTRIETKEAGLEPVDREFVADREPKTVFEPVFKVEVSKFHDRVTWKKKYRVKNGATDVSVSGELTGQYCTEGIGDEPGQCIPIIPAYEFRVALASAASAEPVRFEYEERPVKERSKINPALLRFKLSPEDARPGEKVTLAISMELDKGWHTFSLTQKGDGGVATELSLDTIKGLMPVGEFTPDHLPEIETPLPDLRQEVHNGRVTWSREMVVLGDAKPGQFGVSGRISYQTCKTSCLPTREVSFRLGDLAGAKPVTAESNTVDVPAPPRGNEGPAAPAGPVAPAIKKPQDEGMFKFLLMAVGFGFLSLLTPCVFPMVPITVSFFLKQSESEHHRPLTVASVFCGSIVATFTILGVGIAAIFGAAQLNALANNPWLNVAIGAVFVIFALNMLGLFEIRIPSSLLTFTANKEQAGGYVGAVFMALTFTLTSFTCTFAFAGSLLVAASQGQFYWPIIGMMAFGAAFASPFFFLAMVPSLLKKLPKSGGWMNSVKVVMGLIEIGAAVKFFSVADMVWNPQPLLFDFVFVMIAWLVLSLMIALYLLGVFRLAHDVGSSRVDLQACKLEYSIVSPK